MWHTYTMEYYSAIKNGIMKVTDQLMELESLILSEVIQKDKHVFSSHLWMLT